MRDIEMGIMPYLVLIFWFFGFIFFWKVYYPRSTQTLDETSSKISIIIPARNEEKNLDHLFRSIKDKTLEAYEIIVVDDHSEDLTAEIGRKAGCIVISSKNLPEGWTGKPWACWQGAHKATGDIFVFLDADTFLESDGLSRIVSTYLETDGLLSIQPFHRMEKAYERLSAIFNIAIMVGVNSFTLWGSRQKPSGAFGPCMVCSREDYFAVGGHEKVRGEILESISFGKEFLKAGREVRCYGGKGTINFRMYPEGLRSLIEGFGKGFGIGANAMSLVGLFMMVSWITGGVAVTRHLMELVFSPDPVSLGVWMILDIFYILQIHWMIRRIGNFGFLTALFFQIPLFFFIVLFFSSLLRIFVIRRVTWKGREIKPGEGERNPS
jgi:4,4'-diaponeurosporenoate glycosyltransferase